MVQDRLRDGKRIAQLLASELTGDQSALATVVVADADPDVEATDEERSPTVSFMSPTVPPLRLTTAADRRSPPIPQAMSTPKQPRLRPSLSSQHVPKSSSVSRLIALPRPRRRLLSMLDRLSMLTTTPH
ncbi:hypothetical protein [Halonotius sp. GCM10025705]|uniref:hypothetical protein n=1 Tax=Halonotius sp. GCM10025705 TaxID=3252678 RepID=UPI003622FF6C